MRNNSKLWVILILAWFVNGCAYAPKPPECKGQFKPVNPADKVVSISPLSKIVRCSGRTFHDNQA